MKMRHAAGAVHLADRMWAVLLAVWRQTVKPNHFRIADDPGMMGKAMPICVIYPRISKSIAAGGMI
jgi:hypothetical protein